MTARYIIRFDDICPTMNWKNWNRIEDALDKYGVSPILAIVPDNRDPALCVDKWNEAFWGRARSWQQKGWTIAIHGLYHIYDTKESGIMKLNKSSEFAGHPYSEQLQRIESAIGIFESNGLYPRLFVAPAHSFDRVTLRALSCAGVCAISDGFFRHPIRRHGVIWIPQQIWHLRHMPSGTWTACFHPNTLSGEGVLRFIRDLEKYADQFTNVDEIIKGGIKRYGPADFLFSCFVRARRRFVSKKFVLNSWLRTY